MPCRFLTKEYTFIYLPHIEGLKGNLSDEYQAKAFVVFEIQNKSNQNKASPYEKILNISPYFDIYAWLQ